MTTQTQTPIDLARLAAHDALEALEGSPEMGTLLQRLKDAEEQLKEALFWTTKARLSTRGPRVPVRGTP